MLRFFDRSSTTGDQSFRAQLLHHAIEMRHMRAVLKAQINKTDRNDARGTAQMIGRDYIARYM